MHLRRVTTLAGLVASLLLAGALLSGCTPAGTVLSGTLTDSGTGTPLRGVPVVVYSATSSTVVAQTVTDGNGLFYFLGSTLADGTYRVRFSVATWWQNGADWASADDVPVAAATPTTLDKALVPMTGSVDGTVGGPPGALTGVTVQAVNAPTGITVATTTSSGPSGAFSFTALPAADYWFRFSMVGYTTRYLYGAASPATSAPFTVAPGSTNVGLNEGLYTESQIWGTVLNGTTAKAGVLVSAYLRSTGEKLATVTTASDGQFHLRGLNAVTTTVGLVDPSAVLPPIVLGSPDDNPTDGTAVTPLAGDISLLGSVGFPGPACDPAVFHAGADHTGANLSGLDLASCDLSNQTFTGANLSGSSLAGANLTGSVISGSNVTGTIFDGATLTHLVSGSVVGTPTSEPGLLVRNGWLLGPGVDLSGATLTGQDLSTVDLSNATITSSNLAGANLTGASLRGAHASLSDLTGANFTSTDLFTALLVLDDLSNAQHLGSASMQGVTFDGCRLRSADLSHASVVAVSFSHSDLTGADLSYANLLSSSLAHTDLSSASLAHAIVSNSDVTAADLSSADLSGAMVTGTGPPVMPDGYRWVAGTLVGPNLNLVGRSLSFLDLSGISLSGSNLAGVQFTGTNLSNADLSNTNLSSTNLGTATLTGVFSGGIVGTPASLPPGWTLVGGTLIAP